MQGSAAPAAQFLDPAQHARWDAARAQQLLGPAGFADVPSAARLLQRLGADAALRPALAEGLAALLVVLGASANPDRALLNLERLLHAAPRPADLLRTLWADPRQLDLLVTIFAGSQFLSEIVLRRPEHLEPLADYRRLAEVRSSAELYAQARAAVVASPDPEAQVEALQRWQRRELLRIGLCDLAGLADLPAVTGQLSHLADSLVQAALDAAAAHTGTSPEGLAVLGLGKLGGGELNYSSDIDLVFVAARDAVRYLRLGERLIETLGRVTGEGFLYRVDMRLRPWGESGALVLSLVAYLDYLRRHAALWEKQALLKARVVAGDQAVGLEFLRRAAPLLSASREAARAEVCEMKARIEAQLARRGRAWGEVKLGKGSIRDVEFVTQYLQLVHGADHPEVLSRNTLEALARLRDCGLLSAAEHHVLAEGYTFLRPVEHYLQLMQHRQTHTLPADPRELAYLARRLGFEGAQAGQEFLARYEEHWMAIRAVYRRCLEEDEMKDPDAAAGRPAPSDVNGHLARMAPSYAATFSPAEIERHAALAAHIDAARPVAVDAQATGNGGWRVTIVGYDYPGELSLICGLLFAHGFSIVDGDVFTYEPLNGGAAPGAGRRKIVDAFTVVPARSGVLADPWPRYAEELTALLRRLEAGEGIEAQGELVKRVAGALGECEGAATTLHPIDVQIDNETSERYTVLRIDTPDTAGFLYEFTSALALNGVYVARVSVGSAGSRVRDTLYLTDARGHKFASPQKQQELRAATVLVKHFTHLLPHSPNPESALLHYREFLQQLFARPDWPQELASLERPEVLGALARLLGVSDFLWDDFLRMQHANLFPVVRDVDALASARSQDELRAELAAALQAAADGEGRRTVLNAFKDREMFRIDMRHVLGHTAGFGQFSGELTDLTEVVVEAAYRLCDEELRRQHGTPCLEDGQPCPLTVCALGKGGGRELGFASDIELMFVYAGNGESSGPRVISTAEFYEKVVREFTQAIRARREGIFHVDLQLRPHGRAGSLAVSLESFRRYFAPGGAAWDYERQALIKLRPIAGDVELGHQVQALRDEYVYHGGPVSGAAIRGMRERQMRHLVHGGTINAKFSPGGLVDVEYLVQGLQVRHGGADPSLRSTNTREAMTALAETGILGREEYARLREAHILLRRLIDALRMVRGDARDLTVPLADSEDFAFLARRLGYGRDLARLGADVTQHMATVQEMLQRLLYDRI